jgi:hypothetical protein
VRGALSGVLDDADVAELKRRKPDAEPSRAPARARPDRITLLRSEPRAPDCSMGDCNGGGVESHLMVHNPTACAGLGNEWLDTVTGRCRNDTTP